MRSGELAIELRRCRMRMPLLLLLLTLSSSACADSTGLGRRQLALVVRVDRAAIDLHDSVRVTVAAHNVTDHPLQFAGSFPHCVLIFQVRTWNGTSVGPRGWGCPDIHITYTLAPGDSLVATHTWRGADDVWRDRDPLQPGLYQVVGGIDAMEITRYSSPVLIRLLAAGP